VSADRDEGPVFFLDHAVGRRHVADALRKRGLQVEVLTDHFAADAKDPEWLHVVASRGWVVVTKDKRLGYHHLEPEAARAFGLRMFVLQSGNLNRGELQAVFSKAAKRMEAVARAQPAPFVAKIYKDGSVKIWKSAAHLGRSDARPKS
jgi:predicted nuclease of predicted toxin-antitoxin system